jgi:hypothetical protein
MESGNHNGIEISIQTNIEDRLPGLGDLFQHQNFEVTEEEIDDRAMATRGGKDSVWDEFEAQMIQASCAFMAQEVLRGPDEAPYKGRFLIGEHHEEWDHLLVTYDRLCVLAPRDHGKTFFWDFAVPIWKILTQPNGIGFIFSATQDQAARILGDIRYEVETNSRLQWLVPAKRDKWSEAHIRLANGHQIYARGFGTKVRGAHPTWIVVDDGLNDETAYSDVTRQKQIDYFYTAITNMIVPNGQIIVVGTPFHQADLYADLKKNPEYEFRRYQALNQNENGEDCSLWPERYSLERLKRRREEIGSIRFTREFQCDPIADDMSLFPSWLFRGETVEQPSIRLGASKEFWDQLGISAFIGVDFAMSSTVSADYTVIWTMGVDQYGNRWIMDVQREKGLGFQEQLSLILDVSRRYDPGLIFLEANQMQRIFGDELIRTTDLPIKQFVTLAHNKNALDKGVPGLRVLLENKKVRIPRGDRRSVELMNEWISEMRSFTFSEGKLQSVGTHDDMVMAFWICDQAIRQGSFDYSFGDEEEVSGKDFEALMKELTGEEEEDPEDSGIESTASGDLVGDELFGGAPLPGDLAGF